MPFPIANTKANINVFPQCKVVQRGREEALTFSTTAAELKIVTAVRRSMCSRVAVGTYTLRRKVRGQLFLSALSGLTSISRVWY